MNPTNEVRFRGKDVSGIWHYGNLAILQQKIRNIDAGMYISNSMGLPFAYQVIPETVGQYIGVKDTNNRDIYEGDIVAKFDFEDPDFRSVVVYRLGAFGYLSEGDFIAFACNYHFMWVDGKSNRIVVIGNIYESPELLVMDTKEEEQTAKQ